MKWAILLGVVVAGLLAPSSASAERWQFKGHGEGDFVVSFDLTGDPIRDGTQLRDAKIVDIEIRNMVLYCNSGRQEWDSWWVQKLRRVKVQRDGEFEGDVAWDSFNVVTQTYNYQREVFAGQVNNLSRFTGAEGTTRRGKISGFWKYTDANDYGHNCTTRRVDWKAVERG